MITEDYVSFETAKLMKENGFDLSEFHGKWAIDYDNIPRDEDTPEGEIIIAEWQYPLITLQMAMKWLREKHNIHIELGVLKPYGIDELRHAMPKEGVIYHAEMFHINEWNKYLEEFKHVGISPKGTYEEACEAAIKYTLENLI